MLTVERAKELNKNHVNEESLVIHSLNVSYAMGQWLHNKTGNWMYE